MPSARRRAASRRAAVAVLAGLAAFAAVQAAAPVALECRFPGAIDPNYGGRLARIHEAASDHARVVVALGSSHIYNGLATDDMSESLSEALGRPVRVVNAAHCADGAAAELVAWRRLRRDGVRPDLLLVEVLPAILHERYAVACVDDERMPADRLRWVDLPVVDHYQAGARPRAWLGLALADANALYSHRLGIVHSFLPALCSGEDARLVDPPGPALMPAHMPPEVRAKYLDQASKIFHDHFKEPFDPDRGNAAALRELVGSCRRAGAPLLLVVTPQGPVFRSWYPPGFRERVGAWLRQLCQDGDSALADCTEWIDDEDEYVDSHHLLGPSARRFTERLGREYVAPRLRAAASSP